jgi:uncharacterized membrane protein YidH (DUF202 family)
MRLMSDPTKSDFDPRFDPAFQRGFDPATPIREEVPAQRPRADAPVEQVTAASTVAPPAAPPRVAAPPVRPSTVIPEVAVSPDGDPDAPLVTTVQDADEPEPLAESSQARNPFLVVLAIIAIVLVGVGIWLFIQSGDAFNSREVRSQGDYMTIYATILMAPYISLLGVATAIGVLFLFAAKWRGRK